MQHLLYVLRKFGVEAGECWLQSKGFEGTRFGLVVRDFLGWLEMDRLGDEVYMEGLRCFYVFVLVQQVRFGLDGGLRERMLKAAEVSKDQWTLHYAKQIMKSAEDHFYSVKRERKENQGIVLEDEIHLMEIVKEEESFEKEPSETERMQSQEISAFLSSEALSQDLSFDIESISQSSLENSLSALQSSLITESGVCRIFTSILAKEGRRSLHLVSSLLLYIVVPVVCRISSSVSRPLFECIASIAKEYPNAITQSFVRPLVEMEHPLNLPQCELLVRLTREVIEDSRIVSITLSDLVAPSSAHKWNESSLKFADALITSTKVIEEETMHNLILKLEQLSNSDLVKSKKFASLLCHLIGKHSQSSKPFKFKLTSLSANLNPFMKKLVEKAIKNLD